MSNNLNQLTQTPLIQPGTSDKLNWPWLRFFDGLSQGTSTSGVTSLNSLIGALLITGVAGISVTAAGSTIQISGAGLVIPNFAYNETPANPSADNQNFTLVNTPNPGGSLQLWLRGDSYPTQPLFPNGIDYTLTGNLIALGSALTPPYELLAPFYQY